MLLRLGEVEALYFYKNKWLTVLPETFENTTKFCFILHGYGANAWDLASFAPYFSQKNPSRSDILWIFPQGFLSLGYGDGEQSSRAWFPISVERLMLQRNTPDDEFMNIQQIEDRHNILDRFANYFSLLKKKNLKNMVLGGFSQGGMLAYHLVPQVLEIFSLELLLLFSTLGIEKVSYHSAWEKIPRKSLPVLLQSHGIVDQVLAIKDGKKLHTYLSEYFKNSEFLEFQSGHTIPDNIIQAFFNKL